MWENVTSNFAVGIFLMVTNPLLSATADCFSVLICTVAPGNGFFFASFIIALKVCCAYMLKEHSIAKQYMNINFIILKLG
jgi:hypothetical protein